MRLVTVLAVVLAAVVLALPTPAAAAPLRLMTYNVNWANPDVPGTLDAIEASGADVVLLQEITRDWERALVARFAARYPHRSFRVHGRPAGGLAVLSRHPLTGDDAWAPPRGGWFPAGRLVVDAPGGPVQILHLHLRPALEAGSWVRGWFTTRPVRVREITAYWARLAADLPTIVAGDFNEPADGAALGFLAQRGLTRVAPAGPTTWRYHTPGTAGGAPLLALDIDHVLIDRHFHARDAEVLDAGASDHRPVVVTLTRART